jgi:peptidoglycan/xylan/chitin deacetylase (PgdA/CDA1 family)
VREISPSRFSILMYHSVTFPGSGRERRFSCPPSLFERHINYLCSAGYSVLSLTEIHERLVEGGDIPEKTVSITLDDGFGNNYENAYPVLRKYNLPATIFLVAGLIGKTSEWMKGVNDIGHRLLTWEQIREMHSTGIEFGAHTVSHPKLSEIGKDRAKAEISVSKEVIEAGLGSRVRHFAYPYGFWNESVREMVKQAGFVTACTTRPGFNHRRIDPFLLRRIDIEGTDSIGRFRRKLLFGTNNAGWSLPVKYYYERLSARLFKLR